MRKHSRRSTYTRAPDCLCCFLSGTPALLYLSGTRVLFLGAAWRQRFLFGSATGIYQVRDGLLGGPPTHTHPSHTHQAPSTPGPRTPRPTYTQAHAHPGPRTHTHTPPPRTSTAQTPSAHTHPARVNRRRAANVCQCSVDTAPENTLHAKTLQFQHQLSQWNQLFFHKRSVLLTDTKKRVSSLHFLVREETQGQRTQEESSWV